ncbi:hypothetical protein BH10BDE1_BH10BDE1_17860 [soil metagenome]
MGKLLNKIKFHRLSLAAGIFVISLCSLILVGWHYEIQILKSVLPGHISMKVNTAIGLIVLGATLLEVRRTTATRVSPLAVLMLALVAAISVATMLEYLFGFNFRIDELFYADHEGTGKLYPPGRLAPITAISFLLMAIATYAGFMVKARWYRVSQAVFFTVALISFQALFSYALGIQTAFGLASHTRIAIHTAVSIILLCAGFLSLSDDQAYLKSVVSASPVGVLARRLIAAAIFVPAVVIFLETIGLRIGLFDADFAVLFRVIGGVIFFVAMVLHTAEKLFSLENERERAMQVREESLEAKFQAERSADAKAEFLANMSHEIRTPLNGILGISDLLAETPLDEKQKMYVTTLQTSGTGLLSVINDILDFSKIEARKIELENVTFNLKSNLLSQIQLVRSRAVQKNIDLVVEFDPHLPSHVGGDPGRIGQILLNLLSNAIKFTQSGSVQISVQLETSSGAHIPKGHQRIKFSIRDTGIGIPQEVHAKLFQPFTQANGSTSRKFGGTGLGLSISRRLVELMNGTIGVESDGSTGSNFWFTVDLTEEKPSEQPAETRGETETMPFFGPSARRMRVLVAEDNSVNQMIALTNLKSLGFDAQAVANGLEVLAALDTGPFDLILMDCQMPEMDGYEASRRIRERERGTGARIPIIALTANAMIEDEKKCIEAGMDGYISKPFKRATLATALRKCLGAEQKAS